ncbi:MAG: hypothetical protein ABFE01_11355, partial [Phycisphaerales bacterium]
YNLQYCHAYPSNMRIDMLLHETGHVLGLAHSKGHSNGTHCRNRGCLMRAYEEIESELFKLLAAPLGVRPRSNLCKDCLRDLESLKGMEADPDLSFAGPFLVRREDGYCVASLPTCEFCEILGPSGLPTFDHRKALDNIKQRERKSIAPAKDQSSQRRKTRQSIFAACICSLNWDKSSPPTTERLQEILAKASEDPSPLTRAVARHALQRVKKDPLSAQPAATTPQAQ